MRSDGRTITLLAFGACVVVELSSNTAYTPAATSAPTTPPAIPATSTWRAPRFRRGAALKAGAMGGVLGEQRRGGPDGSRSRACPAYCSGGQNSVRLRLGNQDPSRGR